MLFDSGILPILGIAIAIYSVYKFILWPGFLSPLAKIPSAHPTAPFSPLWILWKRYRSQELLAIHQSHDKQGPVVRLGPDELSINCVEGGIRTVYSGGFEKPEWYQMFQNYGHHNMFSTIQSKPHSVRKRMLSNIYAKSTLQTSPDLGEITSSILYGRMIPRLQSAIYSNPVVDAFQLISAVTMDLVTSYEFGLSAGANFTQNEDASRHFLHLYHGRHSFEFFRQEIPGITDFLEKIGIRLVPEFVSNSNNELEAHCLSMCDAASETLNQEKTQTTGTSQGDHPNVYAQLLVSLTAAAAAQPKSGTDSPQPAIPSPSPAQRLDIASEMLDHFAAGFDTSTITLTYLLWELSARPSLQSDLRAEVLTILDPSDGAGLPQVRADPQKGPNSSSGAIGGGGGGAAAGVAVDASAAVVASSSMVTDRDSTQTLIMPRLNHKGLDGLPLLHAVIMETLRRHPAIPGPQPRITPATPCSLGGFTGIPPNVRVSAQAYSLHRNEDVFPEAEKWKPERWVNPSEEKLKEMQRWFWAFGSGGRMCVGSNLAMLQMKAIVATIYADFTTSIVDDMGIEQELVYTARPKARRLMLRFGKAV